MNHSIPPLKPHPNTPTTSDKNVDLSKPISLNPNHSIPKIPFSSLSISSSPSALRLRRVSLEFQTLIAPLDRVKRLLHYAELLPPFNSDRNDSNRVLGCTAQVWLHVYMSGDRRMRFSVDSDSEITKGFCCCLIWVLDGSRPEEVLGLRTEDLASLNVGVAGRAPSRINTWHNVLISIQKRTRALLS